MKKTPALISFVGGSGSGKTSLLVETASHLSRAGLLVAALKHTSQDFNVSDTGKDTARYESAAIPLSGIVSDSKFSFTRIESPSPRLEEVASCYFKDADILLVEGFKKEPAPKLLVGHAPAGLNSSSILYDFPSVNDAGGGYAPEYPRLAAAVAFIFYAVSRRYALVGVGNRLRGDDAFGLLSADAFAAAGIESLDAGSAPENAVNKIISADPEVVVVFDAISNPAARAGMFGLYTPDEMGHSVGMSSHGTGIGMFLEYLRLNSRASIAVVGAAGKNFALGSEVSSGIAEAVRALSALAVRIKKCTS